jgi:hypothetical protein
VNGRKQLSSSKKQELPEIGQELNGFFNSNYQQLNSNCQQFLLERE